MNGDVLDNSISTIISWPFKSKISSSSDTNWKSISNGATFTIAIKTDGTLWAWGMNNNGQIGDANLRKWHLEQKSKSRNPEELGAFPLQGRHRDGRCLQQHRNGLFGC